MKFIGAIDLGTDTITLSGTVSHTLLDDDWVVLYNIVGTTELNNNRYYLTNVSGQTFQLRDEYSSTPIDMSGFTAYSNAGLVRRGRTMQWGIFFDSNVQAEASIINNSIIDANAWGIEWDNSTNSPKLYHNNRFEGGNGPSQNTPPLNLIETTSNDATPSIEFVGDGVLKVTNSSPTIITAFDNGREAQQFDVWINDANTSISGSPTLILDSTDAGYDSQAGGARFLFEYRTNSNSGIIYERSRRVY